MMMGLFDMFMALVFVAGVAGMGFIISDLWDTSEPPAEPWCAKESYLSQIMKVGKA